MTLDWTQPVMSVLLALQEQGLKIMSIDDGEDCHIINAMDTQIEQAAIACDLITAVDIAWVNVKANNCSLAMICLVLGNEPDELIADYSYADQAMSTAIDAASDVHSARWEGKACPVVADDHTTTA